MAFIFEVFLQFPNAIQDIEIKRTLVELLNRASEAQPGYSLVYWLLGLLHEYSGNGEDAKKTNQFPTP